ncbi:energy-coupling factor transporter ATP-binding protein EcfA2 [Bradyrhizobium sp. USDA 4459]
MRGIPSDWPAVEIGARGLVVYGPNGVGKSSIIDSIEATIRGTSSLFPNARAGVNWEAASLHVKGGARSCTVFGSHEGKDHAISFGSTPPVELAAWMKAAGAASFVLRRYMLLQFIDTEPKDRYEQIEPFLNLDDFANLERGLKVAVLDFETRLTGVTSKSLGTAQTIRQVFGFSRDKAIDRDSLLAHLRQTLVGAGLSLAGSAATDLAKLSDELAAELGGRGVSQRAAQLGAARHLAQQLSSVSVLRASYDQVLSAAQTLAKELESTIQKTPVDLLAAAREHISTSEEDRCPVCEQAVDRATILAQLDDRIAKGESVRLARRTLDQRLRDLSDTASQALNSYQTFFIAWGQLELVALPDCYAEAEKLLRGLSALTISALDSEKATLSGAFEKAECDPSIQIALVDEAILALGGGDRVAGLTQAVAFISCLQQDVPAYEAALTDVALLTKQKTLVEKVHAHAEAARKTTVQKIADDVAELANRYYDLVHPGEGIASAKLTVRSATSSSVLLNSTFHGQEAPPLKYYSESHLDTLGLCFFLAIRKLELATYPNFRLLLVDDVLHSVDAEHRTRLATLLRDHFSDHQIILVTHDKNFYDRLRATFGGGFKYLSISSWDVDSGPRLSDPSTDLDRVLDPSTRSGKSHEEVAAAAGRFFEWLLKQLTERLQVAIPARFTHDHDIGSMWPALAAKLGKHKVFVALHPRLVATLNENVWVRNKLGAHDNGFSASPVSPSEVGELANGIAALYSATMCNSCGTHIQSGREKRDIWRCACSKLQYGE